MLGKWFAARGNRASVVLATNVGRKPDREGLSRANIRTAVGESRDVLVLVGHVLGGETCGPQE